MRDEILRIVAQNIQIYGIKKMNLDLICKELKISKKTIYKYFNSKDEIVETYINEVFNADMKSCENIINENMPLNEKCNKIIHTYHKYKMPSSIISEIKIYYEKEWNNLMEVRNYKINIIREIFQQAKSNGEIKENADLFISALMIDVMSEKLLDSNMLHDNNKKYNEAMDSVFNIIFNGILNFEKC